MKSNHVKRMGVTITFFCMAVVESAAVWGLTASGHELVAGQEPDSWLVQSVYIVGYLVFAGLMVDLFRFVVSTLWRRVLKTRNSPGNHGSHGFA
jgi:hypothetical protein